jgi:hypothetical protein
MTPTSELSDEDDVNLSSLGERQDFFAHGPIVFGARRCFLPDTGNLVTSLLGEGPQIPFLTSTGLVDGRYPAIKRYGLSQLNPRRRTPRKTVFSRGM